MPDSDQITTIPSKPKVPWWKKPWAWIVGVGAALIVVYLVWRLKSQAVSDQKELAALRTKTEHQRIIAAKKEHDAGLATNDAQAAELRNEARELRAKTDKQLAAIALQEVTVEKLIENLGNVTAWDGLDALNKVNR